MNIDFHKEINVGSEGYLERLIDVEHGVDDLKTDVSEIKCTVKDFSNKMTDILEKLHGVLYKLEERDKHSQENYIQNKETFKRFGDKIDAIERALNATEVQMQKNNILEHKIDTITRVGSWLAGILTTAVGVIFFWMFQQLFDK